MTADPRTVARIAMAHVRALAGPRETDPPPVAVCADVGHITNPTGAGCVYCGGMVAAELKGVR